MPNMEINRKTGEINILGDCGAKWAGSCEVIKVSKNKITLDCKTELIEECPDMKKGKVQGGKNTKPKVKLWGHYGSTKEQFGTYDSYEEAVTAQGIQMIDLGNQGMEDTDKIIWEYEVLNDKGGPGKLEGSKEIAEQLYNFSIDPGTDDELGCSEGYGWYGLLIDTGIKDAPHAIISMDPQGFVDYDSFDTKKAARAAWKKRRDDYTEWKNGLE